MIPGQSKIKKIILIGAGGQLAFDINRALKSTYKVIGLLKQDLDITNNSQVKKVLKLKKPDLIINTAAYHKVEECELNPEKSFLVNALGAYYVAKVASEINAEVMFFSTDYVFDGNKKYYTERDKPNPLNIYGVSKLVGESLVKIANPKHYIIRTTGLFGIHQSGKGHNFVSLMLQLAKEKKEIKVVNDQFCSPTYTLDLAKKIKELIDRRADFGIYHITNRGSCSWYELAKKTFELAGIQANLKPIISSERSSNVKRPKNSILRNENLKKIGIKPLRPWSKALEAYLEEIKKSSLF